MGQRAAPFITQHLEVVIKAEDIVPTMYEATNEVMRLIMVLQLLSPGHQKQQILNNSWF